MGDTGRVRTAGVSGGHRKCEALRQDPPGGGHVDGLTATPDALVTSRGTSGSPFPSPLSNDAVAQRTRSEWLGPHAGPRALSSQGLLLCSPGLRPSTLLSPVVSSCTQVTELALVEGGTARGPRGTGLAPSGSRGRPAARGRLPRAHGRRSGLGRGRPVPPQLPGGGQRHPTRPWFSDPHRRGQPQGVVLGGLLLGVGHRDRSCREPRRLCCSPRAQRKSRSRGGGQVGSRGNSPFLEGSAVSLCGPREKAPPCTRASAGSRCRMGHEQPLPSTHALGGPLGRAPQPSPHPEHSRASAEPGGAVPQALGPQVLGVAPGSLCPQVARAETLPRPRDLWPRPFCGGTVPSVTRREGGDAHRRPGKRAHASRFSVAPVDGREARGPDTLGPIR